MLQAVILPKELMNNSGFYRVLMEHQQLRVVGCKITRLCHEKTEIQGKLVTLHIGVYLYKLLEKEYRNVRTLLLEEKKL